MKTLTRSAATALVLSLPLAATATAQDSPYMQSIEGEALRASDLLDKRLYAAEVDEADAEDWLARDPETMGDRDKWVDVGDIHDVIFTPEGEIHGVLADVGGFLGMGEKRVLVTMDAIRVVPGQDGGESRVVFAGSSKSLENAPEFDGMDAAQENRQSDASGSDMKDSGEATRDMAAATGAATGGAAAGADEDRTEHDAAENRDADAQTDMATGRDGKKTGSETAMDEDAQVDAQADMASNSGSRKDETSDMAEGRNDQADETSDMAAEENGRTDETSDMAADENGRTDETSDMAASSEDERPWREQEGWSREDANLLTAEEITGADLNSASEEDIGVVSELMLDESGEVSDVVLDIGGWLGIGAHSVIVPLDRVDIMRAQQGGELDVFVDATREELEEMPEHEG